MICSRSGLVVAISSLFIDMASLLWAFDFEQVLDKSEKIIEPDAEGLVDSGLAIRPTPFECMLRPRRSDLDTLFATS